MAAESLRIAAGSKGSQVFQCADNPKLVAAITEWDSLEKAKSYSQSPALREAQQKSGVYSQPEIFVLEPMSNNPIEADDEKATITGYFFYIFQSNFIFINS